MRLVALSLAVVLAVAPLARADESSHRKAAEDLLQAAGTEKAMQAAMDQTLDIQVRSNPAIAPFRDVMKKFLAKYVSYESIKEDMITAYTQEFSEEELKQLAAFYRTPVGKKAVEKLPRLFAKGAEIGAKRVQENQAELQKMIQDEIKNKK